MSTLLRTASVLLLLTIGACQASAQRPLPPFTTDDPAHWFNSPPLTTTALRGKVLLLDVWTFDCWNCYRSFPWLNRLEAELADQDFRVIGIHSPEFDHERDPAQVQAKIRAFDLHHAVMMDNDFAYWRALDNRYWPAFYLVDKHGIIRHVEVGETHAGDARARRIEGKIRALLAE